ncbi:hypothetical protein BB560_006747, partial [Smittium megazygosporum]
MTLFLLLLCSAILSTLGNNVPNVPFSEAKNTKNVGEYFKNLNFPYPTNKWWVNFVFDEGTNPVSVAPYIVRTTNKDISFGYSHLVNTPKYVIQSQSFHITVGTTTELEDKEITDYSDLSVNLKWSTRYSYGFMEAPLIKGSPYVTLKFNRAIPKLGTHGGIKSFSNEIGYYLIDIEGIGKWAVFYTGTIDLKAIGDKTIQSESEYTGYLRFIYFPNGSSVEQYINTYKKYAMTIPVAGSVFYTKKYILHKFVLAKIEEKGKLLML